MVGQLAALVEHVGACPELQPELAVAGMLRSTAGRQPGCMAGSCATCRKRTPALASDGPVRRAQLGDDLAAQLAAFHSLRASPPADDDAAFALAKAAFAAPPNAGLLPTTPSQGGTPRGAYAPGGTSQGCGFGGSAGAAGGAGKHSHHHHHVAVRAPCLWPDRHVSLCMGWLSSFAAAALTGSWAVAFAQKAAPWGAASAAPTPGWPQHRQLGPANVGLMGAWERWGAQAGEALGEDAWPVHLDIEQMLNPDGESDNLSDGGGRRLPVDARLRRKVA